MEYAKKNAKKRRRREKMWSFLLPYDAWYLSNKDVFARFFTEIFDIIMHIEYINSWIFMGKGTT